MEKYLYEFKNYLSDVKKASPNTVESYTRDVKQFLDYYNFADFTVQITPEKINTYILNIKKSDSSKLRIIASLRSFFAYLTENGIIFENPIENIKLKKEKNKKPDILDSNEIALLLSQPDDDDFKSIRDKAMLELLYATGIKVSELLKIKIFDINLTIGFLHLKSSEKERIVPIYSDALKALVNFIQNVRPSIVCDQSVDNLFTNLNGQPMSRQGFWKIIKFYADKAGIKKDITPQTLRHSCAAHLLENGAKLNDVKEILGYSDISSAQVYAKLLKNKYVTRYEKFHPSKLKK